MRRDAGLFASGLLVLAVALVGLESWAQRSFTGHMVQHSLLIVVVAPLLAGGAAAVLSRVPAAWRRPVERMRGPRWAAWALFAVFLQAVTMILWHVPSAFQAALERDALHGIEHLTMLGTAVLFWWLVLGAGVERVVFGVVALFLAALACSGLGAGLALASEPWYRGYRSIDDQALGGVIMWSVVGLAYFAAGIGLFFTWLAQLERSSPGRVLTPSSRSAG